jgi:hypothetical protein
MYWPVGTPRIYATSSSSASSSSSTAQSPNLNVHVSHDGLTPPALSDSRRPSSLRAVESSSSQDALALPPTPLTPVTPGLRPVEHDYITDGGSSETAHGPAAVSIPLHEPVLGLRVARPGHLFAVITATSMTIWQTKVPCGYSYPCLSYSHHRLTCLSLLSSSP